MTTRRLMVLSAWALGVMVVIVVVVALWASSCPETFTADGTSTQSACGQTRTLVVLLAGGAVGVAGAIAIVRQGRPKRERQPWEW